MSTSRLALVIALVFSTPALAHSRLERSVPADKASLAVAPVETVLTFAERVTLTSVKLRSSDGTKTALAPLPAKAVKEARIPLPALKPARYTVQWRATSDDGHVINGEFSFVIE